MNLRVALFERLTIIPSTYGDVNDIYKIKSYFCDFLLSLHNSKISLPYYIYEIDSFLSRMNSIKAIKKKPSAMTEGFFYCYPCNVLTPTSPSSRERIAATAAIAPAAVVK